MKMNLLYEGKAKKIFQTGAAQELLVEFKDSLTAFNALKKGSFSDKGAINRDIASLLFRELKKNGIESHWLNDKGVNEMLVRKVTIIPLEVVVRNWLAGSTAKKLGRAEGEKLKRPLLEFYYKNDELQDPFVSDDQILMMEVAGEAELATLKKQALQVNEVLRKIFTGINIDLIDFKVEFGKDENGKILLADEITPDCCRLWDQQTKEKLDKDRFRRDLGQVKESYQEVLKRLRGALL
jgi:phosphoribosylaminoimidazole-succinocarboxamide synthase